MPCLCTICTGACLVLCLAGRVYYFSVVTPEYPGPTMTTTHPSILKLSVIINIRLVSLIDTYYQSEKSQKAK